MEAEDSVMNDEQLDKWCENHFGKGYLFNIQLLRDFGKDQAKISFKNGQLELLKELDKETEYARLEDIFVTLFYFKQNKLKELGVEEVNSKGGLK